MNIIKAFTVVLALWVSGAQAAPIVFTNSSFQTSALALAGANADALSQSSPPDALPLLTSADASSGDNTAAAAGIADSGVPGELGFLGAAADVFSVDESTSALGSAEFFGEFVADGGPIVLSLFIDALNLSGAGGIAQSTLLVTVTGNGSTVFSETFSGAGLFDRVVSLSAGTFSTLDLLLVSSADAFADSAFNLTTVSFNAVVPEPSTLLLLVAVAVATLMLRMPKGLARS